MHLEKVLLTASNVLLSEWPLAGRLRSHFPDYVSQNIIGDKIECFLQIHKTSEGGCSK